MVKHTQTIRWQFADELFECVRPFCVVSTERVNAKLRSGFYQDEQLIDELLFKNMKVYLG